MTPVGLAEDHLWLVYAVVNRLARRWPGIDRDELVAAGNLGLVQAADRYDPDRGTSFPHWARIRIEGAVIDSVRGNYWANGRLSDLPPLLSLDFPVRDPVDGITIGDRLVDQFSDAPFDAVDDADHLAWLVAQLDGRRRAVVCNRLADDGYAVLAGRWGLSECRISQIYTDAVAQLRSASHT